MNDKKDIVERLRDDYQKTVELCAEAANEIEALRFELRDARLERDAADEALNSFMEPLTVSRP